MRTATCAKPGCAWWTYVTAGAARCGGCRRPQGERCNCELGPDVRAGSKYNLPADERAELQAKRFKPPVIVEGEADTMTLTQAGVPAVSVAEHAAV